MPNTLSVGSSKISSKYYNDLRYEAQRRNIYFDLTLEELEDIMESQNNRCSYTGELIEASSRRHNTASLDRISSDEGYTKNNVQWVRKEVNFAKQSMTEEAFLSMVEKIFRHKCAYTGVEVD